MRDSEKNNIVDIPYFFILIITFKIFYVFLFGLNFFLWT